MPLGSRPTKRGEARNFGAGYACPTGTRYRANKNHKGIEKVISLTTSECEAFIGRELTTREVQNFDLFLCVAEPRLNNLLSRDIAEINAPEDLTLIKLLIARLVAVISDEQAEAQARGVLAKSVEDFKIEYDKAANTPFAEYVRQNEDLLKKYTAATGEMRAGRTDDVAEYVI